MKVHHDDDVDASGLDAIQETVGKRWDQNTSEPAASPKRGAGLSDDLSGGNPDSSSGLELAQPTLGLLEPELLSIAFTLLIEAGDEALRKTGAIPAREF
jgi:hypothetical protein